MNVTSFSS